MLFWLTLLQSLPRLSQSHFDQQPDGVNRLNTRETETPLDTQSLAIASNPEPLTSLPSSHNSSNITMSDSQTMTPLPAIGLPGGGLTSIAGIFVFFVVFVLLAIWAYTRVYVITPNNEAFVRTGGVFVKKKMVVLNGGCVVLPGFHELTRVPLRELSIDVERTGNLAVRTQDYLRADMRVTFYVCINASEQDVLTAAARLSQSGKITPADMKNAIEKRADDAIRAAAKNKRLAEIDSDKLGFAQEVLNLMQQDLGKVGLTLNNIAISEIQESDT
ncbi:MAG: SPFH domain-containing protein, partial [Cyanobacteria bacterium J06627_8]